MVTSTLCVQEELRQCLIRGLQNIEDGPVPRAKMALLANHVDQRKADRSWVLTMLATLDQADQLEFFLAPRAEHPMDVVQERL